MFGLALITYGLAWVAACAPPDEGPRANLLFIITDQHNAQSLGCAGNADVQTPNLDRLADEGVRFSNAFCQTAQCCPSRFTIWTGRYTRSHGVRLNSIREPLGEVTFAELLRDEGYVTASIGKHHMSRSPKAHGFEQVIEMSDFDALMRAEFGRPWHRFVEWSPRFKADDPARTGISSLSGDRHPAGFWASKAIEFLRANREGPFCLWLSFFGPHPPIAPSPEFASLYSPDSLELPPNFDRDPGRTPKAFERRVRQLYGHFDEQQHRALLAGYYGLVTQIDHNIGLVLDELDQLGLAESTAVIFTSDHGEMMGEHRLWNKQPLNREGTVRVPLIIRAPGSRCGVVCDELVGLIDLAPTILEWCRVELPANLQGHSLTPLLRGEAVDWRDVIFSEVATLNPPGWSLMARSKTRKYLLRAFDDGRSDRQFFDLEHDPWEQRDRLSSAAYAADVEALTAALASWEQRTESAVMLPLDVDILQAVADAAVECELTFSDPPGRPYEAQLVVRTLAQAPQPLRLVMSPGTLLSWKPGPLISLDGAALTVSAEPGSEAHTTIKLYPMEIPPESVRTAGGTVPMRESQPLGGLCDLPEFAQARDRVRQAGIWMAREGVDSALRRYGILARSGEGNSVAPYVVAKSDWSSARLLLKKNREQTRSRARAFAATKKRLRAGGPDPTETNSAGTGRDPESSH